MPPWWTSSRCARPRVEREVTRASASGHPCRRPARHRRQPPTSPLPGCHGWKGRAWASSRQPLCAAQRLQLLRAAGSQTTNQLAASKRCRRRAAPYPPCHSEVPHPATRLPPAAPPQISSKEEPRHYSAKIAWNARNNSHMPLLATGAPAINCAIKVGGWTGVGGWVLLARWRHAGWLAGSCGSSARLGRGRAWLLGRRLRQPKVARRAARLPLVPHRPATPAAAAPAQAVAIARRLLEEDSLELFVQPAFRDRSMANSLALYVSSKSKRATEGLIQNVGGSRCCTSEAGCPWPGLAWPAGRAPACTVSLPPLPCNRPADPPCCPRVPSRPRLQASELTAGKGSKPTVVAGAISNRAREGGCPNITGPPARAPGRPAPPAATPPTRREPEHPCHRTRARARTRPLAPLLAPPSHARTPPPLPTCTCTPPAPTPQASAPRPCATPSWRCATRGCTWSRTTWTYAWYRPSRCAPHPPPAHPAPPAQPGSAPAPPLHTWAPLLRSVYTWALVFAPPSNASAASGRVQPRGWGTGRGSGGCVCCSAHVSCRCCGGHVTPPSGRLPALVPRCRRLRRRTAQATSTP